MVHVYVKQEAISGSPKTYPCVCLQYGLSQGLKVLVVSMQDEMQIGPLHIPTE